MAIQGKSLLLVALLVTCGPTAGASVTPQTVPPGPADLLPLAEGGVAQAQCDLGTYYSEGVDSPDFDMARTWFRKAAAQGHAEAQRRLGRLYDFVDAATHDAAEAARW